MTNKLITSRGRGEQDLEMVAGEQPSTMATVYVAATPIGNLADISPRLTEALSSADIIAAEDTRQVRKLLSHLQIFGKELVSYHEHNELGRAVALIERLKKSGECLTVVSDAGTPCISDPGYHVVAEAIKNNLKVSPIPGPSAVTTLLSVAGLPCSKFTFVGFLPTKNQDKQRELQSWIGGRHPIVFFEATRRLAKTLRQIADMVPTAPVCIGRELTKLFEEIVTLPIEEAIEWAVSHRSLKGEATVVLDLGVGIHQADDDGQSIAVNSLRESIGAAFADGATLKDLLKTYRNSGLSRSDLYQLLLEVKDTTDR